MSLLPWKKNQPAAQLNPFQHDVQRMFDRFFGNGFPGFAGMESFGAFPVVNVKDVGSALEVSAEVPGLEADDIEVGVEGNLLTLRGEKKEEKKEEKDNYYHVERTFGSFMRRIELPSAVDSKGAEAHLEKGVLTLKLPKLAAEASRTIKVKSAGK